MNGIQYLKIWDIYNLVGGAPKEVLTPPQWLWENPHLPESRIPILNLYKLRHLCGNPEDVDTIIIDFGSAWKGEYNKRTKMVKNNRIPRPVEPWGPGTPWSISSPELCLKIALNQGYSVLDSWKGKRNVLLFPLSAASEMWTVACTLYVIFGKGDLFCWYPEDPDDWMPGAGERHLDNVYKSLGILCDHVALLKKMPARWWEAWWKFGTGAPDWVWQYAQYQWTKTATPRRSYAAQRRGLSLPIRIAQTRLDDITGTEEIPLGDWSSLCRLIGSCLKWEPAKRATAKDVAAMIPNDWKYGREPPRPQKRKASIDENCDECDTQPVKKIRNTTRPFGVAKMRRRK